MKIFLTMALPFMLLNTYAQTYLRDETGKITAEIYGEDTIVYTYNMGGSMESRRVVSVVPPSKALPVTLIGFAAKPQEMTSLLSWTTATEINSSHFVVEFSLDGIEFSPLGSVPAQGESTTIQEYHFAHKNPILDGFPNYYRLKMVDQDSTFEHSKVVAVEFEDRLQPIDFKVYPNPNAGEQFVVELDTSLGELTFLLYSMSGRQIPISIEKTEQNTFKVQLSEYVPNGYYIIQARSISFAGSKKILVAH